MSIEMLDPTKLHCNAWQPAGRVTFTPDQLADLDSIKTLGLQQPPRARPHPTLAGEFELIFGWRRRCAFIHFRPGEPMPVDVVEATDAQAFEMSAVENGQRADLTAIEKAHLLVTATQVFGKTQAQAGQLVGLHTQGAVSNLLRLLQLPDDIQTLIAQGQLAERHARQLAGMARIKPAKATELARKIAASGDPDETLANEMEEYLDQVGGDLKATDIPLDWIPAAPMDIEGQAETPTSCARCPNHLRHEYDSICARPACMTAKANAWTQLELARVSIATAIPVAKPGEKAKALKVDYNTTEIAKAMIKARVKPDCLRLVAKGDDADVSSEYYHKHLFDSDVVLLASTDDKVLAREKAAREKAKDAATAKPAAKFPSQAKAETSEQKRLRLEQEKALAAEQAARREAHSQQNRIMHDMAWLVFNTADLLAPQMVITPAGLMEEMIDIHYGHTHPPMTQWPQYHVQYQALDQAAEKATGKDKLLLWAKLLLARELGNNMSGYRAEEQFDWPGALEDVNGLAENLGLRLSAGWNHPPIHHTASNCWVCGAFTSMDHITKRDEEEGWTKDKAGHVTCSDKCRAQKPPAKSSLAPRGRSKGDKHAK